MCILAPLLWRSFFVCIVFGCRIIRILYQARYFFPSLTNLPKSGATDGGHAPELSQRPYQNHGLFAWKLETTQSTSSIITISSCHARLHKKMDWKSTDGGLLFTYNRPRIEDLHRHPPWSNMIDCFVYVCAVIMVPISVERVLGRQQWWMDRDGRVLLVCVESLIGITQVELVLSN